MYISIVYIYLPEGAAPRGGVWPSARARANKSCRAGTRPPFDAALVAAGLEGGVDSGVAGACEIDCGASDFDRRACDLGCGDCAVDDDDGGGGRLACGCEIGLAGYTASPPALARVCELTSPPDSRAPSRPIPEGLRPIPEGGALGVNPTPPVSSAAASVSRSSPSLSPGGANWAWAPLWG